jgi:hypothetical protein
VKRHFKVGRFGFFFGLSTLLAGCASTPEAVSAQEPESSEYCVRKHLPAQAYTPAGWLSCGTIRFTKIVQNKAACTKIDLTTNDTFRVYGVNGDVRLDVDAHTSPVSVIDLEMLPTMNAEREVVFYQGAANGVHYYLFQTPEREEGVGFWYIDIFAPNESNPDCNAHRLSSPDQVRAGSCPIDSSADKQGATGGGGGNKSGGLACT